jgi:hypothetical protein
MRADEEGIDARAGRVQFLLEACVDGLDIGKLSKVRARCRADW